MLISGTDLPLDFDDFWRHARVEPADCRDGVTVHHLRSVLLELSPSQVAKFLLFVTGYALHACVLVIGCCPLHCLSWARCSRPPLLGFGHMDPPFTIRFGNDITRLPSAYVVQFMGFLLAFWFPCAAALVQEYMFQHAQAARLQVY